LIDASGVDLAENSDVSRADLEVDVYRGERNSHRPAGRSHPRARRWSRFGDAPVRPVHGRPWASRYVQAVVGFDILSGAAAVLLAVFIRMPDATAQATRHGPLVALFPVAWVTTTWIMNCYNRRIVGLGPEEFQCCGRAVVVLLAAVGFSSYALHAEVPRGLVVIALPLTAIFSLSGRFAARKVLHRARASGRACNSVVLVGDADSVAELAERMRYESYAGLRVVGACIPTKELDDTRALAELARVKVPLLGTMDTVVQAVAAADADTVAVTSSHALGSRRLRELSWQMERVNADMLVAPGLVEVAGPRLHIRPVTGLPLLHVEKPEFTGGKRALKDMTDRMAAALLLMFFAPALMGIWLAVRLTSPGSGFFRQVRVGKDGKEFLIWKFRSMYADAEARLAALRDKSDGNGVLFKMRSDPRVTPVGAFLRKFSLDELPQLFNVLNGTMSLVGPRPQLPSEVAQYADDVRRRLLVRPGVTGLWQVSGRSDLSWEETVRLDLRYVENWSWGQDAQILWKTLSAVVRGSGAY
jgi:exopolysaccharide biosynthesis polyprenyl glycosylphosphotransferase